MCVPTYMCVCVCVARVGKLPLGKPREDDIKMDIKI